MGKCLPSIWHEMSNCKILHLNFADFSDNQWQKLWEKVLFRQFSVSFPFFSLSNVEEQWVKLSSSNAMGSQHCIRGQGGGGDFKHAF